MRARDARASPTPARCSSCAPASASASSPRWRASKAGRSALLASNPAHLGGAIDADAADKAARFMQLCDAHGLPLVSLVDTPGFMVGPEVEARAQVRHVEPHVRRRRAPARAVLRGGAAQGLRPRRDGDDRRRLPRAASPPPPGRAASSAAMGLEGAVRLGYRKELEAEPEGAEREALFERLVAQQYARRQGDPHGRDARDRRRHRPGRRRAPGWCAGSTSARVGERAPRGIDPW